MSKLEEKNMSIESLKGILRKNRIEQHPAAKNLLLEIETKGVSSMLVRSVEHTLEAALLCQKAKIQSAIEKV